ncbi:MAG: complex I NDUFA9 subunit family protein [Hydrogenophilaceae bacterium]|nr:complex I NDUFA9 subunit family protein [Hydrogenophilaceae bacterium]
MKIEKVCILGGTGFVGHALVSELAARGIQVRVLARRREHAKPLILLPTVEVVEGDIHDERVLVRAFEGCDAVINLVGILHESIMGRVDSPEHRRGDFHQCHIELPRKVIGACAQAGIDRLLHMSALGADPTSRSAYQRSKGIGEAIVREAGMVPTYEPGTLYGAKFTARRGLHVTIFRPSVIFGPADSFLNLFARLLKFLPAIPLACPQAQFQPVYVRDVARAFVESIDNPGAFGQTYDLCGPKRYTLIELMQILVHVLGIRRKIIPLTDRFSYWNAWLLEWKPGRKIMTRDNYYAMQIPNVCTGAHPLPPDWHPADLEATAPGWLQGISQRSGYQRYRNRAHR